MSSIENKSVIASNATLAVTLFLVFYERDDNSSLNRAALCTSERNLLRWLAVETVCEVAEAIDARPTLLRAFCHGLNRVQVDVGKPVKLLNLLRLRSPLQRTVNSLLPTLRFDRVLISKLSAASGHSNRA